MCLKNAKSIFLYPFSFQSCQLTFLLSPWVDVWDDTHTRTHTYAGVTALSLEGKLSCETWAHFIQKKKKVKQTHSLLSPHTHSPSVRQQELLLLGGLSDPGTEAHFLQRPEPLLLRCLVGARRHLGLAVHELAVHRAGRVDPQLRRARMTEGERKVEEKKKEKERVR